MIQRLSKVIEHRVHDLLVGHQCPGVVHTNSFADAHHLSGSAILLREDQRTGAVLALAVLLAEASILAVVVSQVLDRTVTGELAAIGLEHPADNLAHAAHGQPHRSPAPERAAFTRLFHVVVHYRLFE